MEYRALTGRIIGLAIEGHRTAGPGLLESVYAECMALEAAAIHFQSPAAGPVVYKQRMVPLGFRADIVVSDAIILEINAVRPLTSGMFSKRTR